MINKVDFLSRAKSEALPPREDLAIISITEPEVGPAALLVPEEQVLRLVFHDVDPGLETRSAWKLFDEQHAEEVINYVRRLHADPRPLDLVVHCRAGISRSAAIALFVADETGCAFPRRPFSGLANHHLLKTLGRLTGREVAPPRALPKKEQFTVSVARNFETGLATVIVENARNGELAEVEGPMLDVPEMVAITLQQVWGIRNPPPSYHVKDWDSLETKDGDV